MGKYCLLMAVSFFVLTGCQTNQTTNGSFNTSSTQGPTFDNINPSGLENYLVPINNMVLEGSIDSFYTVSENKMIDPILWIQNERSQTVLSKVRIVSINNYKDTFSEIITVRDIDSYNHYSFFIYNFSDFGDNTFIGDEIYIVWSQGINILHNSDTNVPIIYNRDDFFGTKAYDAFISDDIWRVIFFMNRDYEFTKELFSNFYWN